MHQCGFSLTRFISSIPSLLLFPPLLLAQVWTDTGIHVSDGVTLDARIIKPLGLPPSGGFPGIILVHGFGGSKETMREIQIAIASYGYASLAYSVRGQGNSEGLSSVDAERERQDLLEVIQFFRNTTEINPNTLGVAGGSQGGIHSWMAAIYRMPGVKAVAPLIATPDFAEALVPNGCVKYGLPREMTINSVRYSPECEHVKAFIIADQYDSILTYTEVRDLAHLVDSVRIPVLQGLGWKDILFPANGGIRAAENLATRKIPIWSYYGTNGHGQPIDPLGAILGLDKTVQWFDHWLKGFSLAQDSVPMVFYCDDRGSVPEMSTDVWPPRGALKKRFYFTATGLSEGLPTNELPLRFPFTLTYDPSYTPDSGWADMYGGAGFLRAFLSTPARFVSPPFNESAEITGIPRGRIFVESDAVKFQAHVRLYDVASDLLGGSWTLISTSVNGVRENTAGELHRLDLEGTALSHLIVPGNRLGVEITSLDMLDSSQASTIPYFAGSSSSLLSSAADPSYIEFGGAVVAVKDEHVVTLPSTVTLEQNFPNPFNPVTTIRYSLPKSSHVTLKIYSLLGQEVATLIDGVEEAGERSVVWNASAVASGVYFYRLQAGDFSQTKRLLLLQ